MLEDSAIGGGGRDGLAAGDGGKGGLAAGGGGAFEMNPSLKVLKNATTSSASVLVNTGPADAGRLKGTRSLIMLPI